MTGHSNKTNSKKASNDRGGSAKIATNKVRGKTKRGFSTVRTNGKASAYSSTKSKVKKTRLFLWVNKLLKSQREVIKKTPRIYKAQKLKVIKRVRGNKRLIRILKQLDGFEQTALRAIRKNRDFLKPLAFVSVGLIMFSALAPTLVDWIQTQKYELNERAAKYILDEPSPYFASYIETDNVQRKYVYNGDYSPSQLGIGAQPEFVASFDFDSREGYTVTDPVNNISITLRPNFAIKNPELDQNRLIYPLRGMEGAKVLTVDGFQVKEDIILDEYQGDSFDFAYELEIPSGVEARMENNGSIGFYGVDSKLLGNVSASTPEDEQLLEKARTNGEKTNLLFTIPAPVVYEQGRTRSQATAKYLLTGNTLVLSASELDRAQYPISIDPSIYIETARKLMRGNNETNVDFDASNELIKKGFTTGARFDSWNSAMDLNDGRWNQGTATAGGFIYAIGGEKVDTTTVTYTSAGADTFVVPAGVTSVTVETWGAGGGGGGAGTASNDGDGGAGGGGGFARATLAVTPAETLNVVVGGGGGAGDFSSGGSGSNSGDGGGGGGHSEVNRSGTPLIIGAGGGGGGGGDNSSSTAGGAGGAGGGTNGVVGGASSSAPGGGGGTSSSGGSGGNGSANDGSNGGSEAGGDGANGGPDNGDGDGGKNNGGINNGGDGGNGDDGGNGYGGGGGGGSGYYGGGGGSGSIPGNAGGGGGGGGSSYTTGTSTTKTAGSGTVPGNDTDGDRGGAGDGGSGGIAPQGSGGVGDDGIVVISYTSGAGSGPRADVYWAQLSTTDNSIESPNPGAGTCTDWCTDSAYDLPDERTGFSLVAYNGFLYVIGGENDSGVRQNTVYISKLGVNGEPSLWHPTDSNKNNWVYWYASSNTLTNATSYGSAIAYNNRIYFAGGQTNASPGGVTAVYSAAFDPTGDIESWSTSGMVVLPSARHMFTLHTYNDYMYLVGGNSSGTLQSTVYFSKIDVDGGLNTWQSTEGFTTARSTWGGNYSLIWGAYIYLGGGCSAVNGSGYCTTIQSDIQIASINADGSLDIWTTIANVTNPRIGYGFVAWDNAVYRIGGCSGQNTSSGECDSLTNSEDYGVINPAGEVSTVSISVPSGTSPCNGTSPTSCDLPPPGDDAGEGGQLLTATTVLNGYLYVIGGCIDYDCNGTNPAGDDDDVSGNISYVSIGSDGSLSAPSSCSGTSYGAWCVDSTNRVNGTTGVAAAGITTFNNRIYIVGGLTGSGISTNIYYNSTNLDGSLSGAWSSVDMTTAGISEDVAYTYAYARANPASAGSNPGNLFVFGGCGSISSGAGCGSSDYETEVYKCNITTTGSVSGCTTSGQLQIDSTPGYGGTDGLGIHSGTVYANYIFLIGGYSQSEGDKDDVIYAQFDDNNNVVAVSGSDWIESSNKLSIGRRRGWAFGYNGHIYAVGGYDDTGTGIIPFIEWSKMNVSDGSIDPFVTSSVTINQRWGLSMAVSNSYAYVIGGCDTGSSPSGCSSFEPSVQTFQLYNNDSGTAVDYTPSANLFADDRIGGSSVIYNGYIYYAGGCINDSDCDEATNDVQYAAIDEYGNVGTWSSTSSNLPANRAWGQLEQAGGSLYWVGGEDTAGDEKSDVYYATPETAGSAKDVFRTTTYKLNSTEFSGSTYTLNLNNNLEENYFVMIEGAADSTSTQGPDEGLVRVDGDPFGYLGTTTADDDILLSRGGSSNNWVGTVTVVECLVACGTEGFQLKEVVDQSLAQGSANTAQTTTVTLQEDHTTNTVPFGGFMGGGIESTDTTGNDYAVTAGTRIHKELTNEIDIDRYGGEGFIPEAADITIYIVEWGSSWTVQEEDVDNWDSGSSGINSAGDYTTSAITSVVRDETWLWKSVGTAETGGLGDGALGKVLTLGDGTSTQNANETTIALGSYRVSNNRDDTVYVMEHSSLANDYRFRTQADHGTSFTETVDSAGGTETYATVGNIDSTEGYRLSQFYYSDSGTGQAYTRVGGWAGRHTASGTITATKSYSGNNQAGWWQSTDLSGITYTPTNGDVALWETASNGLVADRTRFSAAVWNDRIYVTGGLDDSATDSNTVYISPQLSSGGDITSAWSSDADTFDVARSGHTTIAYANNLYVIGGYDGANYLSDNQFTQINSDGTVDAWTFSTNLPFGLRNADGFASNGYLYMVGGRSADNECRPRTMVTPISANTTIATGNNPTGVGEWYETRTNYNNHRYGASVSYDQGKIYVLGGGCNQIDDDFDAAINSAVWADTTGTNVGTNCGTIHKGNSLVSTGGGSATAETVDMDVASGGTVSFYYYIPTSGTGTCDDPEAGEDLDFEYSTNGGGVWNNIATYDETNDGGQVNWVEVSIPAGAQTSSTRFRWIIDNADGTGDEWAIDTVIITSDDVFSGTDTDRVVQSPVLSQPQVAKYSRLIDTDTDVFPNKFLLNGIDNSIGARWEVRYSSSTDATSAWGQETDFGEVSLGTVNDYTPLNGAGVDTEFARFFYLWIEIDSSHTFGYPDDIDRGPTINDITLFFTADPSKRLRHGKTFTGGEKQPLDTPPGP